MLKALVAEDEPKIRRGLVSLVEESGLFEAVFEAENGAQALVVARRELPDLFLVDLSMPVVGGLEFIQALEELGHPFLVVIVTGHDEFSYAQEAVKLRVFEYVLKPLKPQQFKDLLVRAVDELEARRRSRVALTATQEEMRRNLPLFRELFLREWFLGALDSSEFEGRRVLLNLKFPSPAGLTLARPQPRLTLAGPFPENDQALLQVSLRRMAEEVFASLSPMVFEDLLGTIVILSARGEAEDWVDAGTELVDKARHRLGAVVLVGQKAADRPEDFPAIYEEIQETLNQRSGLLPLVVLTENFLEHHYLETDLSLEGTSIALGFSPGYLSRVLKQQTGHSFVDFVARFRVGKAASMLADPKVRVSDVADMTGFRSQHNFSRTFRRVLGVSPLEYRKGGKP